MCENGWTWCRPEAHGIINKFVDGRADLMVICTCTFVCWNILFVPIYEPAKSAAFASVRLVFALIVLSFSFALSYSIALTCLSDVISIASPKLDVCR
jgi:hypothetical protein